MHQAALVIGGGVAGLVAARDFAKCGMKVTLIERSPFLGGRMAQLGRVFPTGEDARDLLGRLISEVVHDSNVTILTGATVIDSHGIVGDFRTKVRVEPRGVDKRLIYVGNAIAACPEETISEFNYGLTKRKAIYIPHPRSWPQIPAIDWRSCTKCGKCVAAVGAKGINLDEPVEEIELHSGVIVLATGYDPYEPLYGEYGYEVFPEVITLQQLVRLMDKEGPTGGQIQRDDEPLRNIVFIHCAGARQHEGVNMPQPDGKVKDYCARTCCTGTLHAALELKERWPEINIYDLHQDIRTYGRGHEDYYANACKAGRDVHPLRPVHAAPGGERPAPGGRVLVRVKDQLTNGQELEIPADLVVLATGVVPHDISELIDMYKCAVGYDSFLLEVHPKLRPVELAVSGVFLAGSCQGPMDITECCSAAAAAASKAAGMIALGQVEMDPFIALVDEELCTGCQTCLTVCPYEAITFDATKGMATISTAVCTGCGTCAATLPQRRDPAVRLYRLRRCWPRLMRCLVNPPWRPAGVREEWHGDRCCRPHRRGLDGRPGLRTADHRLPVLLVLLHRGGHGGNGADEVRAERGHRAPDVLRAHRSGADHHRVRQGCRRRAGLRLPHRRLPLHGQATTRRWCACRCCSACWSRWGSSRSASAMSGSAPPKARSSRSWSPRWWKRCAGLGPLNWPELMRTRGVGHGCDLKPWGEV